MRNISLEKPDAVFLYAPVIEDICIEFGIDRNDAESKADELSWEIGRLKKS